MHFYPPKTTLSQPARFRSKPRQHSSPPTYFATDHPHKNIMTIATRLDTRSPTLGHVSIQTITTGNVEINIRKKRANAFLRSSLVNLTFGVTFGSLIN